MFCECQLAPPANTADNLLSALASAKTAADMIGSAGSGVKQCERMEVGTEWRMIYVYAL